MGSLTGSKRMVKEMRKLVPARKTGTPGHKSLPGAEEIDRDLLRDFLAICE
jgi:hypothetical protein